LLNKAVEISYSLNGATEVKEYLSYSGAVGSSTIHTFALPLDMTAKGKYSFKVTLKMPADVQPINDTATFVTNVFGFPIVDFNAPNDTFLVKFPFTLNANPGYPEYLWQDNSTNPSLTITKQNYQPQNTVYTVIVTNANGCSVSESVNVIEAIKDLGINGISIPLSNCALSSANKLAVELVNNSTVKLLGQNITLKYSINGGAEISKDATVTIAKGAKQIIEFIEDLDLSSVGTHNISISLIYPDDENTLDNSANYDVKVFGYPTFDIGDGSDTIRTSEFPYTLDAGDFQSYKWQDNSTNRQFNVNDEGNYLVTVTDNNGCSVKDSVYIRNITGTGSLENMAHISIYPNPVSNYLYININLEVRQSLMLDIIDQNGKTIFRKNLSDMNVYSEDIDVSGYPKGLYYVRIKSEDDMVTQKVVVK